MTNPIDTADLRKLADVYRIEGIRHAADEIDRLRAEVGRLTAKVAEYQARLEIDHVFTIGEDGQSLVRVDVPPEERDRQYDGITCRDETIKLCDKHIRELGARAERAEALLRKARPIIEERAKTYRESSVLRSPVDSTSSSIRAWYKKDADDLDALLSRIDAALKETSDACCLLQRD